MISPVSSSPIQGAQPAPVAKPAAVEAAAPEAATVQISLSAQVKQLNLSGSTYAEIEMKTGLDLATIKQYLGK